MYINSKFIKKMAPSLILAIFFVTIDRLLKVYALRYLDFREIVLLGDWLKLDLAKNTGIAFSIPITGLILNILLVIIVAVLVVFIVKLAKKQELFNVSCLTIIAFGAISNIYDRFRYGFVIDYIDLKWFTVFNVADMMIVVGVLFLILSYKQENDK